MTAEIFVTHDEAPEDMAMLQALYSRSPAGVKSHLEKLKASGSGSFMERYYVGYGHASIGDCGTTTVFIEQVSMLAAKAIQDHPLYSGQEASTRYLDFSKQEILDPYHHPQSSAVQSAWLDLYKRTLAELIQGLTHRRPFDPSEYKNETVWKNALSARAFDIARCLLPVGATTLLSWTTNLRQARDHLRSLKHHPLPEVRDVAHQIFSALKDKYTHSFRGDEMTSVDTRDAYAQKYAETNFFIAPETIQKRSDLTADEMKTLARGGLVVRRDAIDIDGLNRHEKELLATRPSGAALPRWLDSYGRYNLFFLIDFGSFRDIQRHRNGVCQIPRIDGAFGLNPWYEDQLRALLSPPSYAAFKKDFDAQMARIQNLSNAGVPTTPLLDQYLYPMGMQVLAHVSYSVPQVVYVGELRSGKTVHGSLRPAAQNMLRVLQEDLPGIAIYGDFDLDDWSAKRGEQTILEKAANG